MKCSVCTFYSHNEAIILIACEVGGREHGERVIKVLEKNGYNIVME